MLQWPLPNRQNNWIYIFMYRTRLLTWLDTFVSLYFDAVFATFLLLFHLWPGGNAGCLCFSSTRLSLITTLGTFRFLCVITSNFLRDCLQRNTRLSSKQRTSLYSSVSTLESPTFRTRFTPVMPPWIPVDHKPGSILAS